MIQVKQIIDKGYRCRYVDPDDVEEKDINDMILSGMTKDQIQTIIKNNTYQGNMGKMKFATWRKSRCLINYQHNTNNLFTYQDTHDG